MSILDARRSASVLFGAALVAVGALSLAPQASAQTLYACLKKNGTARVFVKKPKCKKGESKLTWNTQGIAGKNGLNGANGINGSPGAVGKEGAAGANGLNGAVAGFGALQSETIDLAGKEGLQQIPGLTKKLPAGSFIVSAAVEIDARASEAGTAGVLCELSSTPSSGSAQSGIGRWISAVNVPIFIFGDFGEGVIAINLPVKAASATTLAVKCEKLVATGKGLEIGVNDGSIVAVQTSGNS